MSRQRSLKKSLTTFFFFSSFQEGNKRTRCVPNKLKQCYKNFCLWVKNCFLDTCKDESVKEVMRSLQRIFINIGMGTEKELRPANFILMLYRIHLNPKSSLPPFAVLLVVGIEIFSLLIQGCDYFLKEGMLLLEGMQPF